MSVWTAPINDSDLVADIEDNNDQIVHSYNLFQNYPNPFNPTTTINYQVPSESYVRLKVYDVIGNEIATLINEIQQSGCYNINFNSKGLSSGIYL